MHYVINKNYFPEDSKVSIETRRYADKLAVVFIHVFFHYERTKQTMLIIVVTEN